MPDATNHRGNSTVPCFQHTIATLAEPDDRMLQEVLLEGALGAQIGHSRKSLFIKTLFISIEDVEKRSADGNQDGRILQWAAEVTATRSIQKT